jgi:aspartyl-tRNA synthetase
MIELAEKFSDKKILQKPFPRITYKEALSRYGSDKPDLRFNFEIKDVSNIVRNSGFSVFTDALKEKDGVVYALKITDGAKFSRKEIDELTEKAKSKGLDGLAYIIYGEELKSPLLKHLKAEEIKKITAMTDARKGDIVFFGAGAWKTVCLSLGIVREECGKKMNLKDPKKAAWLWIYDFPMYDYSETEPGKIDFSHNPFSMPQGGLKALQEKDPLEILAYQYDLVCNGFEISSGAVRNHSPEVMYKAFAIAGYGQEEVDKKFGHMIRAFQYGAPPHAGFAPGIDRLMMVLWECPSIRDIYAFPLNGQAQDVMLGAPSEVSKEQLKELHIKLDLEE